MSLTKIVDLLVFMAQHHGYRIKYYILRNNVLVKVLALTKRKEKFVVLAALKLLRACVGLKDEFYNRYLVKSDLFEPIVRSFRANGEKYNLLNSAILELVDFVRRENVRNLVAHLLEKFKDFIDTVEYCETFKLLKERHENEHQSVERDNDSDDVEHTTGAEFEWIRNFQRVSLEKPSPLAPRTTPHDDDETPP